MLLEKWHPEYLQLRDGIERSLQSIKQNANCAKAQPNDFIKRVQKLRETQLEKEVQRALGKSV